MKPLPPSPGLTDKVYQALRDEICNGALAPGTHLVQEQLAAQLDVSRQPIQQALALLKSDGLVRESGRRGLFVAPLDIEAMRHHYEIRAALDGLAARRAAERAGASPSVAAEIRHAGTAIIAAGSNAIAEGALAAMVGRDIEFHGFIYQVSGNPLLAATAEPHWRYLRRVMGEVLRHAEPPPSIWRQHREILDAIVSGDPEQAKERAVTHVRLAGARLTGVLAAAPPTHVEAAAAET
ncbi:MAG: GntR family transcriptional regulator [Hyphomicrobiaceae bacterium]